jgi:flagellar hook capping protein FlgD
MIRPSQVFAALCLIALALVATGGSTPAQAQVFSLGPGAIVDGGGGSSSPTDSVFASLGWSFPGETGAGTTGSVGGIVFLLAGGTTIVHTPVASPQPAGAGVTVAADVFSPLDATGTLNFRLGGQPIFQSVPMTRNGVAFHGVIPGASVGERGVEYFVGATVGPVTYTEPSVDPDASPHAFVVSLTNFTPGTSLATVSEKYRMVGFAADVSPNSPAAVFEDDLGSQSGPSWRLGRFDPVTHAYKEFTSGTATDPILPGNAFWLVTEGAKTIDFSGTSRPRITTFYSITLRPGFNQIANPVAFDVDLNDVAVVVNGNFDTPLSLPNAITGGFLEEGPLQEYVNGHYDSTSVFLKPWTGYFVANLSSNDMVWEIPYRDGRFNVPNVSTAPRAAAEAQVPGVATERAASRAAASLHAPRAAAEPSVPRVVAEPQAWRATLEASPKGTSDAGDRAIVELGLSPQASEGHDRMDRLAPPAPPGTWLRASSHNENLPSGLQAMRRDVRPLASSTEEIWAVDIEGNPGSEVQLRWATEGTLPAGSQARLIDPAAGRFVDLDAGATYTLTRSPRTDADRVLVAVGTGEFVKQITSRETAPQLRFALSPVAPNPVRRSTSFEFNIPAEANARLQLFDVGGRMVRELSASRLPAGQHIAAWDGRRDDGAVAPSGVYYLKLSAAGQVQTRRFVYIR